MKYLWVLVSALCIPAFSKTLPVPTLAEHQAFLVGEWKPNVGTVVVFKDPFCPYCIQAFKQKDQLKNFNVFLFWYPIFGEPSEERIASFFKCSSPVSSLVVESVLARKSPDCVGATNSNLQALNQSMYEAYSPPGVPAYYLGGTKVTVSQLLAAQKNRKFSSNRLVINGVALDLNRYSVNTLRRSVSNREKILIYIPKSGSNIAEVEALLEKIKADKNNEWVILIDHKNKHFNEVCKLLDHGCADSFEDEMQGNWEEFQHLLGLSLDDNLIVILKGRLLDFSEKDAFLASSQIQG